MAELANLALSDDEIARMAHDLDEILTHIDKLNELDTSGVEPMAQVLYEPTRPRRCARIGSGRRSANARRSRTRRCRAPDISKCPR